MNIFIRTCISIAAVSVVSSTPALACDLCAVYNAIESASGPEGSVNLGLTHRYLHSESNVRPAGFENYPGQHMDSFITQMFAAANVTNELTLQLNVPVVYKEYRRIRDNQIDEGSESGLGDIALLVKYAPYRVHDGHSAVYWEVHAGVKLPTGDTDRLQEETTPGSEPFRHQSAVDPAALVGGDDLTLGSGAYDFLLGSNLFYQYQHTFFSGSLQYTLRQEGDYGYEFGNDLHWEFGPGYFIDLQEQNSTALRLKLSGEYKADDSIRGVTSKDSSVQTLYLGPELLYTSGSDFHFNLGTDFVLDTESASEEVAARFRLLASIIYRL